MIEVAAAKIKGGSASGECAPPSFRWTGCRSRLIRAPLVLLAGCLADESVVGDAEKLPGVFHSSTNLMALSRIRSDRYMPDRRRFSSTGRA